MSSRASYSGSAQDVRLTVQLIDTDTVGMVWSQRFARSSADTAASHEEFSVLVASQLRENIVQAETNRAMSKQGRLSAWEHVLRAASVHGAHELGGAVERRGGSAKRHRG